MKPHLPKKLFVALIAAISTAGFTLTQAQAAWEGGANEGSEYYTNTGRTNLHLTNTSDALITFTAEQEHVTAGIAEVTVKDLATVRVRGGNHWGVGRAFDMLTIDSIKAGDGSGTVFVNAEKYNNGQAASNSTATVLGINGTLGGVQNYGVLTLGADGGTINASGAIMNNSGATLTLNGTYTFDLSDTNSYVMRTEGDVKWSDEANQQGFKKTSGSTYYAIKGATEGTNFSVSGLKKESDGNYYFTGDEVTDYTKFYVKADTATLDHDGTGQIVVEKAGATVTVQNAQYRDTSSFKNLNIVINDQGVLETTHSGASGFITGALTINAGGIMRIVGEHDAFGWGSKNQCVASLTMKGEEGKLARLELNQSTGNSATMVTDVNMQGYSTITSTKQGGSKGFNTFGCNITASGVQNNIDVLDVRRNGVTIDVAEAGDLTVGKLTINGSDHSASSVVVKQGEGTLHFTGETKAEGLNIQAGTVDISGTGELHALTIGTDGTLNIHGTNTVVTAGGTTNSLSSTIIVDGGTLNLNGTFAIDGNEANMSLSYSDGTNGFKTFSGSIIVYSVKNNGTVKIENNAAITFNGIDVKDALENGVFTVQQQTDLETYYVNAGSTGVTEIVDKGAQRVFVRKDAVLKVDVDTSANSLGIESQRGTVNIGSSKTLTGTIQNAVITGSGTYALNSGTPNLGSNTVLDENWTGTVRIGGFSASTSTHLDTFANGSTSTVEIYGITGGYLPEYSGGTVGANIKLTNPGSSTPAWIWSNGGSYTITFSGDWSGDGTFRKTGSYQSFAFSGDISEWQGAFELSSSYTTNLTFKGNATEVNAAISKPGAGTLNIIVGDGQSDFDTTFGNNVTASSLQVMANASATMTGTTTLNSVTLASDALLENTGTMTLNGRIVFGNNLIQNNGTGTIAFGSGTVFDLVNLTPGGEQGNVYTLFSGSSAVDLSTYGFNAGNITGVAGKDDYFWTFGVDGTVRFNNYAMYEWAGTATTWSDGGAGWIKGGQPATYVSSSESDVTFVASAEEGFVKDIAVNTAVAARNVDIQDDYTFSFSESGSLTIASMTVVEGKQLTLDGTGTTRISSLENNGEISINADARLDLMNVTANNEDIGTIATGRGTLAIETVSVSGGGGKVSFVNATDNGTVQITGGKVIYGGNAEHAVQNLRLSHGSQQVSTVDVLEGATLHIQGTLVGKDQPNRMNGSFSLSHWSAANVVNVYGTLISDVVVSSCDGTGTINVYEGGRLEMRDGLNRGNYRDNAITINVAGGATLATGTTYNTAETKNSDTMIVTLADGATLEAYYKDEATTADIVKAMTLGAVTVETGDSVGNVLTLSGALTANGTITQIGDGTLVLAGPIDITGNTGELVKNYAGGLTQGNGFLESSGIITIYTGDNASLDPGAVVTYKGENVTANVHEGKYSVSATMDYTSFYVKSGSEMISTALTHPEVERVVLSADTIINMDAATSVAVAVEDGADNTIITATEDITITSLDGPADGKTLTISAAGHEVALRGDNTFRGNLVVDKGTVKLDTGARKKVLGEFNGNHVKDQPAPAPDKAITINEGGTIDLNGKADLTYVYTLNGGSLVNYGGIISSGSMQTVGLILEADSTIGGTGDFYLLGPSYDDTYITLNDHKLVKTGENSIGLRYTTVSSGTIEVQEGNIQFVNDNGASLAADIILHGGSIGGTLNLSDDIAISSLNETETTLSANLNLGTHTVTFDGSDIRYNGVIHGEGALTKEGDGTLTIGTANDYTGGTVINGGVVVVENATALGSGDVALNGAELHIATDTTINGQITVNGENMLVVADAHTLTLGRRIANYAYVEMHGTYDISNLSAEFLESKYTGGAVQGNGFLSDIYMVQVVDNAFGAYAEMSYAYFLYNGIEGEAGYEGEVTVTSVDDSVFYVNSGTDKVSKAFKDHSPASILMKNGTGLDLDKASADIPNIELSADALTAVLNVKQTSTIDSLTGGDESSTLTINGSTGKALTLVDASGYNGSMAFKGGAVTAGSATAFGTNNVSLSGATLDLGGFEFANSINVVGNATIGHGTLSGSISLTDAALQVGSDLTAEGSLTTNGISSIGVAQDATLTLMQTITNEGSALSLSGTFDVSALSTIELEHTYTGGATTGNGFYTGNLGIQVVDNTQGGTSDLTNGTFLYNGEEWAAGNEGYAVKATVDYTKFYVNSGTESVLQAYRDHTPDTILLKRATGLNLDATDIELPNIELAAYEDTAYLNVMQDTTIDSITGGDGSFILDVYGMNGKTLTLMDASGYIGSMVFAGGTVTAGSATAFGTSDITLSSVTLDLSGFEIANAMNLSGGTTIGNGTLTGSLSAYNTTLHVGSDATVDGTLTTDGTSSIEVSQDATLTLGQVVQNTGVLALAGTFDISALSSVDREPDYTGGITAGNGFYTRYRDIEVVANTQDATSDLTGGSFIYNGETADTVAGGTATLTNRDYSRFYVFAGEESLGTALDAAYSAGTEVGGVTMSAGTTLHVDRDMGADFVSVASGSVKLDIKGGSTVTEGATPHSEYILTGSGVYALASGNASLAPTLDSDWTGTVALKDVVLNNPEFLNLDNYGHEGSVVRLDGVKANFGKDSAVFATTMELVGDGLEITACQAGKSYEFAGGVTGEGNLTYNLSGYAHMQTYIFSGDVADWTGSYESAVNKTSTLQFYGDATEMGAAIRQTAGTVNVVVGGEIDEDGNMVEHSTTFENEVEATDFTVKENATAVIENKATVTGSMKLDGTLELAEGGSLALSQDAAVQVGNIFTVTGKGDTSPALSGNLEITEVGFYGIGDKAARIDHSVIKLEEGASVVFDNVILGASSQLKDDPATVVVNNMVIEGILGENVQEGEPLTIKSGSVLHLTGDPGQTVVIEEDSFACTFDITNVQDVQLSGNCLTIDLSSMYPKFKDMGESFDWLGIALGSGDHAPTIDENLEVVVQTLPNQRAHGYVGWGGTFVTVPEHGENVGPVIYFHMYEVPEPTTSTLSLLALAALAARRRRK